MKYFPKYMIMISALFFSIISKELKAQFIWDTAPWCPDGATWIYKSFSPTSTLYYKFSYEKDTIIDAIDTKKINVEKIEYLGIQPFEGRVVNQVGVEFLFERNDSIFWFDFISDSFKFIYSFIPQIGDSFIVENSRASCLGNSNFPLVDTLHVISTYIDTFGTRIFDVFNTSSNNFNLGVIVSKIGSLDNPFPEINRLSCATSTAEYGDFYEGLVCYSDLIRGSVQFSSFNNNECHSINTHVSDFFNNTNRKNSFIVYPNPADNIIFISQTDESQIKKILIYGIDGKLVFEVNYQFDNSGINVHQLIKGLYIIKIVDSKNNFSILKFLKS